jgi:hypothetical protein
MSLCCHQTTGQSQYIKVATKSSKNVAKLKYSGMVITDQICINEEINSQQNSGNAFHHAVQNLLSSHMLSKNVKIKIFETIILLVFA